MAVCRPVCTILVIYVVVIRLYLSLCVIKVIDEVVALKQAQPVSGKRSLIDSGLFLAAVVAGVVLLVYYWRYIVGLERYGYLGLFLLGMATAAPTPLPIFYLAFIFTLGHSLNPMLVGAIGGLALACGAALVYAAGRGGRRFLYPATLGKYILTHRTFISHWSRFLRRTRLTRFIAFIRRRSPPAVFVLAAVPNPVFAAFAASLGVGRFPFWKFFLPCWSGETVKAMILAYLGYLGLGVLFSRVPPPL